MPYSIDTGALARRRHLIAGLSLVIGLWGLAGLGLWPEPAQAASRLEIRASDYRLDRETFRTTLRKVGPSPQTGPYLAPPADVTQIEFPSGDLRLKAWVGKPRGEQGRLPVVIFLHGGFSFGGDDFEMAQPYREAGFVVVTPMLRGENGQAGTFSMFYDEVDDVLAAARAVRGLPYVDSQHVYLAGHSIGATIALLSAMASSDFKAVASFSASPDQIQFCSAWSNITPFDMKQAREFEMRSPLSYAASLKSPARLYYGSKERSFGPNTERLAQIAQAAGLPVEARATPGDHFSAVPAEIADSIEFFRARW